jgi:rhodanese-related sulfurtransferase
VPQSDGGAADAPYQNIEPDEAQRLMAAGALVVDVRQPDEYGQGHIAGARLMPLDGIYAFGRAAAALPRDADVIFVCAMGQRSALASEVALVAGLAPERVYNLAGGMRLWLGRGRPIER